MKTFINLTLDTRSPKKDGTYPVILRITHFQTNSQITLGIYLLKKDWDAEERKIKSSYKGTESVTRLNNFLQKKKSLAIDVITKLDEKGVLNGLSALEVKQAIERKPESSSFIAFANSLIEKLKEANRIGNAKTYQFSVDAIKGFIGKKDFTFRDISPSLLEEFEIQHLKKGKTYNGLAVYLRTIRAIFNRAIKDNVIDADLYPFKKYTIKSTKTRKRAIRLSAIKAIENVQLEPDHPLHRARHYFILSFHLRGISFTDLAHLRVGNVVDGRVHYQRQKTDSPYDIKLTDKAKEIIDLYIEGKPKDAYIFPIIKRTDADGQYKDVAWARKRFNKKLKKLAALCNIEENLTSYVSRHSFATGAKNLNVDISDISKMLGHKSIKTTEIYIEGLPTDLLDEIHERIVK